MLNKTILFFEKINTSLEKHSFLLFIIFLIHIPLTYVSYLTYIPFIYQWPWHLKLIVPTCTVVLGAFTLAFLQYSWQNKVNSTLALYCVIAGVSYGFIMTFVLFPAQIHHHGPNIFRIIQIFAHFGMIIEGFIFLKFIKLAKYHSYLLILSWFLIKFLSDISLKTSYYIYNSYDYFLSDIKYFIYLCLFTFQLIILYYLYKSNNVAKFINKSDP
jgi:hypothetical protein